MSCLTPALIVRGFSIAEFIVEACSACMQHGPASHAYVGAADCVISSGFSDRSFNLGSDLVRIFMTILLVCFSVGALLRQLSTGDERYFT